MILFKFSEFYWINTSIQKSGYMKENRKQLSGGDGRQVQQRWLT